MIRSLVLTLATIFAVACSQSAPPPSSDATTPPATPAAQAAPPAQSAEATPPPAAAGTSAPAAQAAPASAPASAASSEAPPPAAAAPPPPPPPPKPKPEPPPAPKFREVTVPAGTEMSVKVLNTLASDTSKVEDPVKGSIAKSVVVSGATAIPEGSQLTGSVIDAKESGRVKGKAALAFRFDRLVIRGETHRIQTASVSNQAAQDKKGDVKKGGLGAGLGAVVGGIAGGGKGAAIGAVAGGVGTVMATKGNEVQVPPGTIVTVLLQDALTVSVPVK
jgi:outer membrane biosynthesis protein TonB